MSSRGRAAIAFVIAAVFGVVFLLREEAPEGTRVATFESRWRGETVNRGGFEQGERVITPNEGSVLVQTPDGAHITVGEYSEAVFASLDPLRIDLVRGQLTARTHEGPLTLTRSGQRIELREHAAVELLDGPPRLVVTSGTVTLDGQAVTGQHVIPSAP